MYQEIKTQKDIQNFLEKTNQLHDGYVISVKYNNNGIKKTELGHSISPWKTTLSLQVLVTSLYDTIVELEFECLYEWQFKEEYFNSACGIFEVSLSFDSQGHIIWADDVWQNTTDMKTCSYVIAESVKWRIVE